MIPWERVDHLNFGDSEEEVRTKIFQTPHSRLPVIDSDVIVGILLKKELPDSQLQGETPWQGILQGALRVKEDDRVLEAFLKMQEKKTPLSIVEDSEGKYVGIITIEDIIEEVVGDIDDKADYSKTSKILSNRPRINLKTDAKAKTDQ
jgi:CBS domain containing-hemolysin-like protein